MFDRRQLLARGVISPALLALTATAPAFITQNARPAQPGKERYWWSAK